MTGTQTDSEGWHPRQSFYDLRVGDALASKLWPTESQGATRKIAPSIERHTAALGALGFSVMRVGCSKPFLVGVDPEAFRMPVLYRRS